MTAPLSQHPEDVTARVQDYLADRIQSTTDLHSVNELLERVRSQQSLLRKQLAEAKAIHKDAEHVADTQAAALRDRAARFQQDQTDLDRQLRVLTQSDVSDHALQIFEARMNRLRRIEVASGYLEILQEADALYDKAQGISKTNMHTAIQLHGQLWTLLHSNQIVQPIAEDAAPHLLDHISARAYDLNRLLRSILEQQFQQTLASMKWPKEELELDEDNVRQWQEQCGALLALQEATFDRGRDKSAVAPSDTVILMPLQIMINPLELRFRYHFFGHRPTNHPDKPEYFFRHILDLIEQQSPFFLQYLQPIINNHVKRDQHLELVYPDALSSFVSALLPMVLAKCVSLVPQLTSRPQLFSHFIHETMSFDRVLRESWTYAPLPTSSDEWKGITWEILTKHEYFNTWLDIEKEFALSRYRKIRDASDSDTIDYDAVDQKRTKPTKGAIRVNDLLETITDRYRALSSFSQKMKFLIEVQLWIFDDYHQHLHGVLQAYLVSSHTAGRLIKGQSEADALGSKGLESLLKLFGSSEYLERKMGDWSHDVFFLELWEELQDRAQRNTRDGSIGRDLNVSDVAAKTSSAIKTAPEEGHDEGSGALFDETARSYRRLRERSEAEINRIVEINVHNAMKPLFRVSTWASISSTASKASELVPSSALDFLTQTLSTTLSSLAKALSEAPLRRVTRHVCQAMQRDIIDNVILRHTFSAAGAAQLQRDAAAIYQTVDSSTKIVGTALRNMKKLEDVLTLLNLPIAASRQNPRDDADDEDAWDFDTGKDPTSSGAGPDESEVGNTSDTEAWGLWEAEKAIFANNESARHALQQMRLYTLTESEARNLLSKRIEINS